MSTREREAWEAIVAPPPSTSVALVPLRADREPVHPPPPSSDSPPNAHRYFYAMGYAALGMILLGTFFEPRIGGGAAAGLFMPAMMMLGIGGLGVLIHVLYKPSLAKLRKGLGAVAALVLTLVATVPVSRVGREVHASARVARLQPLADDLVRDGRIHRIAVSSGEWVALNDFEGNLKSSSIASSNAAAGPSRTLYEVLRRDGISRLELVRLMNRLRAAGVSEVGISASAVTLWTETGADLLYVRPGQALASAALPERRHTQPLGGGWYLLVRRGWLD
ncbi:hypothetical protein [Longimicrobium sp.]|uniref:hypothetical protein n=1 Tax=Longimicrobium sp. TaxID=2029185 RepID=UPI002E36D8BB|nr:hypothetical protein [Longimicrobium sp.]HEX6036851.1 hypothetical protein [Longimicrobium sp.]